MSAPTVMRPSASVAEEPKAGQTSSPEIEWAKYAKWGLIAALVLTAIGLTASVYVTYTEKSHTDKLRGEWDEFHNAVFEKKSDDERIEALEKVAENPKIKGTTVHAYVLSSLAHAHFEMAQNPRRQVEARRDSLERVIALNRLLAENEPFKSNPLFGPIAVQNLASALEQKQVNDPASSQFYDEAIKTLRTAMYKDDAKDADPIKAMKTHFLFNKLNAELGRLYWLRGLRKIELDAKKSPDAAKTDNEFALFYLKSALESGISSVEKDRFGPDFKGGWREEAAYIKSLLDPVGKMMPGGVAPAMKPENKEPVAIAAAPTGAVVNGTTATITTAVAHGLAVGDSAIVAGVGTAGFNGTFTVVAVPTPTTFTFAATAGLAASGGGTVAVAPPKKVEMKKEEPKKEEVKKDEPKKEEAKKPEPKKDEPKKEEPKKTGSLNHSSQESMASNADAPSQHMSYAQIQALLKQGRPALCQCPRCANSDKAIGAKLEE